MTQRPSDDEIAAEYDRLFTAGREMEGMVPVRARVAKNPRAVFSVRLALGELSEISNAAQSRDMPVSEFMRLASLAAARGYVDLRAGEQAQALLTLREKARELYEAVEKLEQDAGEDKSS